MQTRIKSRRTMAAGLPRAAGSAVEAAGASAEQQHRQPLPARFPALALELVRSKLPTPTLAALRLVSRAVRDDFVDARCTRVRPLWDDAPFEALVTAAPRLHSLTSLSAFSLNEACCTMQSADCAALASALERLPAGGAALRELRLCPVVASRGMNSARRLKRLAAAVGRLAGLRALSVAVMGGWNCGAAALVEAAGRLSALAHVSIALWSPGPLRLRPPRPQLQSLRLLQTLSLAGRGAPRLLDSLLKAEVAAALTCLRSLRLNLASAHAADLPPAPWRAPWLAQLTLLGLRGDAKALRRAARALGPCALPALRTLEVGKEGDSLLIGELRALLAACGAGAGAGAGADAPRGAAGVSERAPAGVALSELQWLGADCCGFEFGAGAGAACRDFEDAPRARLTRLALIAEATATVSLGIAWAAGLEKCFASDWAHSLRELSVHAALAEKMFCFVGTAAMRGLQGASALTALEKLAVSVPLFHSQAVEAAVACGWAAGWAPRLVEFELRSDTACIETLLELLNLPFSRRLRRLAFATRAAVTPAELAAFSAACAARLPWLAALDFGAGRSAEELEYYVACCCWECKA